MRCSAQSSTGIHLIAKMAPGSYSSIVFYTPVPKSAKLLLLLEDARFARCGPETMKKMKKEEIRRHVACVMKV
jgi:hypothetical protein